MKKIITKMLCLIMGGTMLLIPVSAQQPSVIADDEVLIQEEINLDDINVKIRDLSVEEAALTIKNEQGISYNEALSEVMETLLRGAGYQEVIIEKNFGESTSGVFYADWTVEVGAVFETATGSGHSNFVGDPIRVWSAPISSGEYTWDESYPPIAEIRGSTKNSVYLQCRGTVTIKYTTSSQMGFDVKVLTDVLGFSFSSSTSGNYYYRKSGTISDTYTMPSYN